MTGSFTVNAVGKICKVYCQNFVTYEECTFYPTEYLNVIIGPNGTGKSTLVSAIVLCLGGEPITLCRAKEVQEYIKNGYEEAKIMVEICANNNGKTVAFTRSFNTNNKSQYFINNEPVNRKKYLETIACYKIQVTNLCQFLPQDRVQDFAKMNPQEILNNTINSVCSPEVQQQYEKLKELQSEKEARHKKLVSQKGHLKECLSRIEDLKARLSVFNQRKEYQEKVQICNAKKLWLEVDEMSDKIKQHEHDFKLAHTNHKKHADTYKSFAKNEMEIKSKTDRLQSEVATCTNQLETCTQILRNTTNQLEEVKQKVHNAKANYEKQKLDMLETERELENEKRLLEVCKQDLKDAKTKEAEEKIGEQLEHYTEKSASIKNTSKSLVDRRIDINRKLDTDYIPQIQQHKRRIDQLKNIDAQKLQLLEEKYPDVYAAMLWLREHRNLFEGRIYNPLLIELNINDSSCAKYFENCVSLRDFLTFTCEEKSDVSKLINELCVKKKLSVNVGHAPPADRCHYQPAIPIEEIRKYGFTGYLINMINGPPAPLNYLCSLYPLHKIPFGPSSVRAHIENIPSSIRQYFAGDQRIIVTVSKYSNSSSTMQLPIASRQILHCTETHELESQERQMNSLIKVSDQLKNERSQIEQKIDELKYVYNELKSKINALEATKRRVQLFEEQCKRQEQKVLRLSKQITNAPDMEQYYMQANNQYLSNLLALQEKKIQLLKNYQVTLAKKQLNSTSLQVYAQEIADISTKIEEVKSAISHHEKILNTITNSLQTLKRNVAVKTKDALASTNNAKPDDRKFPYRKQFAELPNTIAELKEFINDYAARLECMADEGGDIAEEYETKLASSETAEASINNLETEQQRCINEITTIFEKWLAQINAVVDTLKCNFSDFMKSMNYVGDIVLVHKEQHDFESYGIQIMVQYRTNEIIQPLDRTRQSGGERAVAIAVYSLSMQHISNVPFRCVDEINQGMDAKNERKIFHMLVEETTKIAGSQYFFVTPKLLPKLPCNERMSVHIVYNGRHVGKNDAFYPKLPGQH